MSATVRQTGSARAGVEALRAKLRELKALHEAGTLGPDAYAEARAKLERELVDAVMASETGLGTAEAARAPRRLQAGLAFGVFVLAIAGYSFTGTPSRLGFGPAPAGPAVDAQAPVTDAQVTELVDKMAQRLQERPDDSAGWTLLARAYSAMGRTAEAVPAFEKALALAGEDASLMADYADARAAQNNGRLDAEAQRLVSRALVLEPENVKALALSGSVAFDDGDYPAAVRQWEKVERVLPADSGILPQVRSSIAQARQLGGMPPAASVPAPTPASPTVTAASPPGPAPASAANPAPGPAAAVSGRITLAPALAAKVAPEDTVFVLARAATGPRMPLAVLRRQVRDLPLAFTLDDSMAMAPTAKISDQTQVVVSARISKSGDAMPKPGDFSGQSAAVAPGARDIAVVISDVVGQ